MDRKRQTSFIVVVAMASLGVVVGAFVLAARVGYARLELPGTAWIVPVIAVLGVGVLSWFLLSDSGRDADQGTGSPGVYCPVCGTQVMSEWRLCPYCGEKRDGCDADADRATGTA